MPVRINESYTPPKLFFNSHIETIYPALLRKVKNPPKVHRKRVPTPDGDFLDLDMMTNGNNKLIIVQHGLEGSSKRAYVKGMGKIFYEHGFDACLWNFRGCSEELNSRPVFYHSGATYDLETVYRFLEGGYEEVFLVGFSLGGNLTLKFMGEKALPPKIKKAVVFSVPMDLDAAANNLMTPKCFIYEKRFLKNLKQKVRKKAEIIPDYLDLDVLEKAKTLRDFDDYVTAPLHGFESASDYYRKCSSKYYLEGITVPTLIVNALNDPLLTPECLDHSLAEDLKNVTLEITPFGGHVGFARFCTPYYWSEIRALNFIVGDEEF